MARKDANSEKTCHYTAFISAEITLIGQLKTHVPLERNTFSILLCWLLKVKCKGKFASVLNKPPRHEDVLREWRYSYTPRPLYLRSKNPQYPWDRRLGGPQSQSGQGGEEKNSHHCPCRELNPGCPACSLVTILTELSTPMFSWDNVNRRATDLHIFVFCLAYGNISGCLVLMDIQNSTHGTIICWVSVCMYVCTHNVKYHPYCEHNESHVAALHATDTPLFVFLAWWLW
jgi:hypothetical protein